MRVLFGFSQKIHYSSWNIDLIRSLENLCLFNQRYINLDYLSRFNIAHTHLQHTFIVLFSFEHPGLVPRRNCILILFMSFLFVLDDSLDLLPVANFDIHLTDDNVRIGWHLKQCLNLSLRVIYISDPNLCLQYWIKGLYVIIHTLNRQG